jgi:ABC-type ATPase involved in cell division
MATHDSNIVNDLNKRVITFEDKKVVSDVKKGKYNLK